MNMVYDFYPVCMHLDGCAGFPYEPSLAALIGSTVGFRERDSGHWTFFFEGNGDVRVATNRYCLDVDLANRIYPKNKNIHSLTNHNLKSRFEYRLSGAVIETWGT